MAYFDMADTSDAPAPETRFSQDDPRCESCSAGMLHRRRVDMAFWSGRRLVLVEDVPALVCDTCGEQYTEDRAVMQLDLMRGADFRHAPREGVREVPVFRFPGSADETR